MARHHMQDSWDAAARAHADRVARAAALQPGQTWVVVQGINGWVQAPADVVEEWDLI